MKLFLDDIRIPSDCTGYMYRRIGTTDYLNTEDWFIVRNYDEFIEAIEFNSDEITHVSFDHALADEHYEPSMYDGTYNDHYNNFKEKTGYDCAMWMRDYYEIMNKPLPQIIVHSMNPVGTQNIINVFKK